MKLLKSMFGMAAALSMTALPVMASAATNPAAKLSLAPSVRTGATATKSNKLAGGALIGVVILAGVVAIAVVAGTRDNNGPTAKSP